MSHRITRSAFALGSAVLTCVACTTFGADDPAVNPSDAAAGDASPLDASPLDASALDADSLACPAGAFCDDFDAPMVEASWDLTQVDGTGKIAHGADNSFRSAFEAVTDGMAAHALLVKRFAAATKIDASFDLEVAAWPAPAPTGSVVIAQVETSGGGPSVSLSVDGAGKVTVDAFDGTGSYARYGTATFPFGKSVRVSFYVSFGQSGKIVVDAAGINLVTSGFGAPVSGSANLRLGGQHYVGTLPGFQASYDGVRVISK